MTTPSSHVVETPTKSSTYRSPHRSPLDALLFTSSFNNNNTTTRLSLSSKESNDSATPTAIKASLILSNANTGGSIVASGIAGGGIRKASKPLPGLPPGKSSTTEGEEQEEGQGTISAENEEITPPSLPSFSNLKLSEMRMSGMWFAQP